MPSLTDVSLEAKAKSASEHALRLAEQRKPFGGPDWVQKEGWPIYAAMVRHTQLAVLEELTETES